MGVTLGERVAIYFSLIFEKAEIASIGSEMHSRGAESRSNKRDSKIFANLLSNSFNSSSLYFRVYLIRHRVEIS